MRDLSGYGEIEVSIDGSKEHGEISMETRILYIDEKQYVKRVVCPNFQCL